MKVSELEWSEHKHYFDNKLYAAFDPDGNRFTVLDRVTGYGGGATEALRHCEDALHMRVNPLIETNPSIDLETIAENSYMMADVMMKARGEQ